MSEALKIYDAKPLTATEIKEQVQVIQQVLRAVMIEGIHYGTIPGTPKPTLYKPGSEKILTTFHIGVDPREEITDLSTADTVRYRVFVKGFSQGTGNTIGVGCGEASSEEEKYKWRKPVCDAEFDETPESRRRIVWKKGNPAYQQKQVRTNPADVANTILKMAKKRSQIDMTLTATAASDVFDQDLEDIPEEIREGMADGAQKGAAKTSTVKPGNGTGKATHSDLPPREALKKELADYCGPDQGAQNVILKECSKFTGNDNKERYIMVGQIDKAKDGWIGTTLGKLRDYVKAHPKEQPPTEASTVMDVTDCPKIPDDCETFSWHGDVQWCDQFNKECPRQFRG